jgi:UDP-N-acetylmuramoylalanine--D-glutamate ligase
LSGAFEGQRVLVVGAGVAGRAAAVVLLEEGATVRVTDARGRDELDDDLAQLEQRGLELRVGGHRDDDLDEVDWLLASPGVPPSAAPLVAARARGVPVTGELQLGAALATAPYLAVTGTNGKTTTTGMLAACLRAGGLDAVACGNIGRPFPTTAREEHDVLVVECSSFQLARQDAFHPRVSVLLNLSPDHLDWHGSVEAYEVAKAAIYARQEADDVHVGNRDDDRAAGVSSAAPCRVRWFGTGVPREGEVGYEGDELVARIAEPVGMGRVDASRPGYRADAAAAAAAALAFGVDPGAVAGGLAGFHPPRHRGDVVAEVGGVRFVDDSKATNVHAALAAIDATPGAVLIAGGRAKGVDLSPLAARASELRGVVAIGEATDDLIRIFEGRVPVRRADSIDDAVRAAHGLAGGAGTVLLAPACASWDMFRDYEERGERFTAAARALHEEAAAHG